MQVVVAFEEAGAGGGDEGLEERGGAGGRRDAEARGAEVGEEAFEQTELGRRMLARTGRRGRSPREGLTCQTNGKLFRFKRANMSARNFQAPALPAKPSLLRRAEKVGAIAWEA